MIGDGSIGTIATSDFIDVVVTDGQHVLWAGDQAPGVFVSTVDGAAISAHFSGGFVRAAALTPSGGAVWLAANPVNTRVYWGPSDGSAAVSLALAESPLEISGVVSVDESVAWTTNGAGGQLWRRSFAAGEEPTLVHQSEGAIHCLRRRGEFFYFTVSLPGPDVPLVELPLGGGVPREIARIPTAEGVNGFYANCAEIGPRAVYWTAVGRAYGAAL
jgi:hypothetical protein